MIVDDHPMWRDGIRRDLVARRVRSHRHRRWGRCGGAPGRRRRGRRGPHGHAAARRRRHERRPKSWLRRRRRESWCCRPPDERDDVLQAVKAGAAGYLVKSASRDEMVAGGEVATADGRAVFTPDWRAWSSASSAACRPAATPKPVLSPRADRVLRYVAKGMTTAKRIAANSSSAIALWKTTYRPRVAQAPLASRVELARYAIGARIWTTSRVMAGFATTRLRSREREAESLDADLPCRGCPQRMIASASGSLGRRGTPAARTRPCRAHTGALRWRGDSGLLAVRSGAGVGFGPLSLAPRRRGGIPAASACGAVASGQNRIPPTFRSPPRKPVSGALASDVAPALGRSRPRPTPVARFDSATAACGAGGRGFRPALAGGCAGAGTEFGRGRIGGRARPTGRSAPRSGGDPRGSRGSARSAARR